MQALIDTGAENENRLSALSASGTPKSTGKTFLQKLGDVVTYNQNMQNANSIMAVGKLFGSEQLESTGQQMMQSANDNYVDSVKEFQYITERGAGGAAKGAENFVNALGYLGQMQNRAQIQQNAQTLGAWGALTGNQDFKGASEHMGNYAQELKDTGLQDTAKFGTKYQQGIQERYADADITKTGKALGDVSETVGGLAPSAVMNVIAPGSGIVVSALGAGGNATQEALANGASDHEALAYGTAVGAIEAATEKIFDGMAGLFGKGAADDVIESMAKKLAKREGTQNAVVKIANSLGEGMEEFISEVSTRVVNELMDNCCVKLKFTDGSMIAIDTIAVENEVARNMYERSELDYLIYNAPLEYADLIFNGDPETYLKTVTEYKPLVNHIPPVPITIYCRDGRGFCVCGRIFHIFVV